MMRHAAMWAMAALLVLAACASAVDPARAAEATDGVDGSPTPAPSPAIVPSASPGPGPTCSASVQAEIDAAPEGGEVLLPPCVIRETLRVARPMTLRGVAGTEIRGSDVWTDWHREGALWRSARELPDMPAHGECVPGTTRCLWPEEVFRDGVALLQVGADPGPDEFSVPADRQVLLGSDPAGHTLEVGVRPRWIVVTADGVIVDRVVMRHATNDSQSGALQDDGHAMVIRDSVLTDAHGADVWLTGRSELLDSEVAYGGQLGIGVGGARVAGNHVHDNNNTEAFDPGWEAGGFKAVTHDVVVEGNEIDHNAGSGIWFDIGSSDLVVRENRVNDNLRVGIFIEISTDVRITGNTVWGNGREEPGWVNGAGILVHSSTRVEVDDNLVAWNGDGIGVASQDRPDRPAGAGTAVRVHDNTIVMTDGPDTQLALGWVQDWAGPMFDAASANEGDANRFWYPTPEGASARFAWSGPIDELATFAATPGGHGSSYLADAEARALLHDSFVPTAPDAAPRGGAPDSDAGTRAQDAQLALVGILLAALLLLSVVAVRFGVFPRRWLLVGAPLLGVGYLLLVVAVKRVDLVPDPVDGLAFVAVVGVEVLALVAVGVGIGRAAAARGRPAR